MHKSKRAAVDQQSLENTTNKVLWPLHIRPTVSSCIAPPSFFNDVLKFQRKVAAPITFNVMQEHPRDHHQSNSQSEWRTERRQRRSRHLLTSWFRSVGPFEAQRIRQNDTALVACVEGRKLNLAASCVSVVALLRVVAIFERDPCTQAAAHASAIGVRTRMLRT